MNTRKFLAQLEYFFVKTVLTRTTVVNIVINAVRIHDKAVEIKRRKPVRIVKEQVNKTNVSVEFCS